MGDGRTEEFVLRESSAECFFFIAAFCEGLKEFRSLLG